MAHIGLKPLDYFTRDGGKFGCDFEVTVVPVLVGNVWRQIALRTVGFPLVMGGRGAGREGQLPVWWGGQGWPGPWLWSLGSPQKCCRSREG